MGRMLELTGGDEMRLACRFLFTLTVATLSVPGCKEELPLAAAHVAPAAPEVREVRTVSLQRQSIPSRIQVVGSLYAAEEVTVSTRAAGILRKTFVDVGAIVKPGDALAQVDTVDYQVAVKQSEAALAEILARLGLAEPPGEDFNIKSVSSVQRAAAQLQNAQFSFDRLSGLREGDIAKIAEQEFNDAATRLGVAEAEHRLALDEAAALVATARERQSLLQMSRQRHTNTLTVAPPLPTTLGAESGDEWVVSQRMVTEGQYLVVADQLYHLMVRNPLKLRSKVPERYVGQVALSQRVELVVAGTVASAVGKVRRISPSVDPVSRTFEIEALITNDAGALKPGAFAKGVIVADDLAPALCVPPEAILMIGGVARLYVVEDGKAQQRDVQTGRQTENCLEVTSGLAAGAEVVLHGGAALKDGMPVQIKPAS